MASDTGGVRIGVLIVAYNAASTLASVLDRLPPRFRSRVDHVLICDDASDDETYTVGLGYQAIADMPITVIRHAENLGYGGNQKAGYRWALDHQLDVVVLLHGDGQYAPEVIEQLVEPLEDGRADAVFGSRLLTPGAARSGGMPMYKYLGNRILSRYENTMAGMNLSEWHSGYRAYRVDALSDIPFERNSDGFDFDTEIIVQLHEAGKRIVEVPIPTYYGDEICHVNGLRYAKDVAADVTAVSPPQAGPRVGRAGLRLGRVRAQAVSARVARSAALLGPGTSGRDGARRRMCRRPVRGTPPRRGASRRRRRHGEARRRRGPPRHVRRGRPQPRPARPRLARGST